MFRFILFFLFIVIHSFAQNESVESIINKSKTKIIDRDFISKFNTETLTLKHSGSFSKALRLNTWLLDKINKKDSVFLHAEVLHIRSRIYIDLGKYTAAISIAKNSLDKYIALNDKPKIAALNNIVGVGFYFKSQLDSTLYYYNKSFNQKKELKLEKWQLAISAYNIGLVYEDLARYDEAISLYSQSADLLLEDTSDANFLSDTYLSIANSYKHKNNLVKALEYTTLALNEGIKKYGKDHPDMSFVYESNAGVYQALGNYKTAKLFINKTIFIREKYFGTYHKWTAQSYGDLSEIMLKTKKIDSALWAINKALEIEEKVKNEFDFGDLYQIKSEILFAKKNTKESLKYTRKSRVCYKNIFGGKNKAIASTWLQEAKIHFSLKDTLLTKKAIEKTFINANYKPKDLKLLQGPFIVLEALQIKFQVEVNPELKLELLNKQIEVINYIKRFYHSSEAKLFFNTTTSSIINDGIDFCFNQYSENKMEEYATVAFELMQLNNNSILAEELQVISNFSGSPKANTAYKKMQFLRQKWSKVKQDLYFEQTKEIPLIANLDSLVSERVYISRELDEAIHVFDSLTTNLPQQLKTYSIIEIQKKIDTKTQLINYFIGNEYVYVFGISSKEYQFLKLSNSEGIKQKIRTLREGIYAQKNVKMVSQSLFQDLLFPVLNTSKKELIFIPNGILGYVPFEILSNKNGEKLLQLFLISYNSAVSLLTLNTEKEKKFKNYWSGFGVSYSGNQEMPKGIMEINTIRKIVSGKQFINKESSIESLILQAKNSEIIHLALHGKVNIENPLYSELLLYNESITSSQIYNEDIRSNLVVLSACDTGYGTIQKGEGVMSLSRAFTFAGASSTLTSLWKVPDKETSQIMVSFYEHLNLGESKNHALQNAKLDYLNHVKDETLKHPYYWAGFILTGETSPLVSNTQLNTIVFFSAIWILCLIVFLFYYKRRKQQKISLLK